MTPTARGVDIVLNSLTGAAQRAGIKLLSFGGRFVEIGKRDIYGDTRLGLFPFRRNLMFYAVDLGLMSITHPAQIRELLSTVYRLTAEGTLPMPESTQYPLAEAANAIRVMSAAEHTGKLILDIPHTGHSSVVLPPEQVEVFRPDGAYIITGGLGGLGLFLAEKMASCGAGRIVLSSRSAPNQKVLETIELVRATGSDIVVECGDIAQRGHGAAAGGSRDRHRAAVARRAACGRGGRGRHAGQHHRRADRPQLGAQSARRVAPASGSASRLKPPAAGLVLFVLLGGRPAGLAGSGRLRRGQQLAGRLHSLAAGSGPSGHRDRLGRLGRDRPGRGPCGKRRYRHDRPDEGAYAFEALLRHNRAYSGYAPIIGSPWLTSLAQRSQFAEAFRSAGQ